MDASCANGTSTPVTLLALWSGLRDPAEIRAEIQRTDGTSPLLLEQPFGLGTTKVRHEFDPAPVLAPGDSIGLQCSFERGLPGAEWRCDHFLLAYPANALGGVTAGGVRACPGE
ncbi:MAG: hypothetical protein OEZ06_23375 [Myxococcales bacterium]|nr:hypothetical protein [Myxococcales bacterium]